MNQNVLFRNKIKTVVTSRKTLFIIAFFVCLSGVISPPIALAIGLLIALTTGNPYSEVNHKVVKYLLQLSVIGLGFGMNLKTIIHVGQEGVLFTITSISTTLILGYIIGRWLNIHKKLSHLISTGTAICGGSAIAAVSPVMKATDNEMSVALGAVFILNSIALFIFPPIGHFFNLTQTQFGFWAGIAIHDTSSVVGAAAKYGQTALQVATTVKLTRALWIVPVTLITAFFFKGKSRKVALPYFIFLFLLASIVRTYFDSFAGAYHYIVTGAQIGLTVTLFLIGAGLSKDSIKVVGIKPLLLGIILWILVSVTSLYVVLRFVV